ncbi:hypothetical protein [Parafrankia discariae]|uniref:hypothetical protein n=1 Tax=Parafrankia discariae TaxID=365528 RepID=UPI0003683B33|nr:hypothetical protein [Parafrankia discariae]
MPPADPSAAHPSAAHRPARPIGGDEIRELIDRDEAYDENPYGEPPLLVARYRASLRAVLATEPAEPGLFERAWSQRERDAYRAGGQTTHRAIVTALATALTTPPPDHEPGGPANTTMAGG